MNKILKYVVLLCILTSCKTQCVPERIEVEKIVEYHHRDTTIVTEADSASAMALLECDSNFNVVLADLAIANGDRLSLSAQLRRLQGGATQLDINCHEDSLQHRIEWLEKQLREKRTETIVKEVRKLNRWDKFCHWFFFGTIGCVVLIFAGKAVKMYFKI